MPPKCFVLMPLADEFHEAYEYGIKPAAEAAGFTCYRADSGYAAGAIIEGIIENIFDADIIVADITSSNPNVFYELGIAHTIDNKTIVICEKGSQKLPFDLRSYRIIFYRRTIEGIKDSLRRDLEQAFADFANWHKKPNNPVQNFRPIKYTTPLQEQARLEVKIAELAAQIRDLRSEKERDKVRATILYLPEIEFQHLRHLAAPGPFSYVKRDPFLAELKKLRSLSLIAEKPGATISALPEKGNLKDHLDLTDTAREVLEELFRRFADGVGKK